MLFTETEEQELLEDVFGALQEGLRLDVALAGCFAELSRNRAQGLIEEGEVRLNGEVVRRKKHPVRAGDRVSVLLAVRRPLHVEPEEMTLAIVYEDSDLLVIDKPRGMVVHPAPGNETHTLVNGLLWHIGQTGHLSSINGEIRPGIVHRIDKNTSGLLVVAKNDGAHHCLSEQFAVHSVTRKYWGLARGGFRVDSGTIDEPLGRDPKNRKKQKVRPQGEGRRAVTHYRVLERYGDSSLLELRLETGRTHQIRAHMAHIGHPLMGDDLYGPEAARGDGQILHAMTLAFRHPDGSWLDFSADPPPWFQEALEKRRSSGCG